MNRPSFKTFEDYKRYLRTDYRHTYGLEFPIGMLKKFSTLTSATGVAHYYPPSSGISGIDSIYLNPIGRNTRYEGIVVGNSIPTDIDNANHIHNNRHNARSFGIKTPFTYVGWGHDIFGYPAPNSIRGWSVSGVYTTTAVAPTGTFAYSGTTGSSRFGSDTQEQDWMAGPLDVRWDNHRKVWTGNYGVYPALITKVNLSAGSDVTLPYFASTITYDAVIYDGVSSGIRVTGIRPSTPVSALYKYYPIPTGTPCLISHSPQIFGGITRPGFGLLAWEKEYAESCAGSTEDELLLYTGGDFTEGRTGYNEYVTDTILVGDADGELDRRKLTASTGIHITIGTTDGDQVIFSLDSSVSFNSSGVNQQITELAALTTPITIAQGGTGSSVKTFVDLTTNQGVGGTKTFSSGIILPSGLSTTPFFKFDEPNNHLYGLAWNRSDGIMVVSSGSQIVNMYPTGILFNQELVIKPTIGAYSPLTVYQQTSGPFYSRNIQEWRKQAATGLYAAVDTSGYIYCQGLRISNSGRTNEILLRPPAFSSNYTVNIPATGGTIATVDQTTHPFYPIRKVSGIYSIVDSDTCIFVNTNATGCIVYLPNPTLSTNTNRNLIVKDYAGLAGTNSFTIISSGTAHSIDDLTSLLVSIDYTSYNFISDGTQWYIL